MGGAPICPISVRQCDYLEPTLIHISKWVCVTWVIVTRKSMWVSILYYAIFVLVRCWPEVSLETWTQKMSFTVSRFTFSIQVIPYPQLEANEWKHIEWSDIEALLALHNVFICDGAYYEPHYKDAKGKSIALYISPRYLS